MNTEDSIVHNYVIDQDRQIELRKKFNPDGSDIRKAQLRMLDLLKFLDKICKENKLEYWLDSGTLLGAARHGGFIPWDDDTDVCMMKEDAEKLKKIMQDKIWNGHIVLQSHDNDPYYYNPSWMTLRDTKSEYLLDESPHNKFKYKGLQIDIFIMEKEIPLHLLRLSRKLYNALIISPLMNRHHLSFLQPLVPYNYKIINIVLHPIFNLFRHNSNKLSSGFGAMYLKIQEENNIFPLEEIYFEGIKFKCPRRINEYLTNLYGEWQKLPTSENINTHGVKFKILDL